MNNKKKYIGLLSLICVFIVLFFVISLLNNRDISNEKLGPSPFLADESIAEENNVEYLKLQEIAKSINGEDAFNKNVSLQRIDFNNPEPEIVILQEYIKKNNINLDTETIQLFKDFKFPKPKNEYKDPFNLYLIILHCYKKILLEILLKDFDSAKKDFIYLKQVNEINLNKSTSFISGWAFILSKQIEFKIIKHFIENPNFTIDQKLEILEIQHDSISSKFLINILHFEEELIQSKLLDLDKEFNKTKKYGIFKFYIFQPNNSVNLFRKIMNDRIKKFEMPKSTINDIIEPDTAFKNLRFYSKNSVGILILNSVIPEFIVLLEEMQKYKNNCNQFLIAKEILYFRKKRGVLPQSLKELSLPQYITIDKFTNEQFLYSAENGILQSVKSGKNDYKILTSKKMTKDEIRRFLKEKSGEDYILYLEQD